MKGRIINFTVENIQLILYISSCPLENTESIVFAKAYNLTFTVPRSIYRCIHKNIESCVHFPDIDFRIGLGQQIIKLF